MYSSQREKQKKENSIYKFPFEVRVYIEEMSVGGITSVCDNPGCKHTPYIMCKHAFVALLEHMDLPHKRRVEIIPPGAYEWERVWAHLKVDTETYTW